MESFIAKTDLLLNVPTVRRILAERGKVSEHDIVHFREEWYNEKGERHREDGPAVESANGDKEYYQNGQLHREDGPALVQFNGTLESYYQNGELHRIDGPATIISAGKLRGILSTRRASSRRWTL